MPRSDYHLHGESSQKSRDREEEDYTSYGPDGSTGAEYFEQYVQIDQDPESSSEERGAEHWEEPISIRDDVGMVEYERMLERQRLPVEVSATRERIIPIDIDAEDVLETLQILNDIHIPSKIRDGLYVAKYVVTSTDIKPEY